MNVWSHLPTIFNRRLALQRAGLIAIVIALITTLFFANFAQAATNKVISFQARLSTGAGAVVPDGRYNIQFKIYEGGEGTVADNPGGTLKWTETYVNNNDSQGVRVKNGVMSVNLGAKNAFGDSVDWSNDTLWLSMNIAGRANDCTTFNAGSCSADGEMLPMKRITAVPFALNADTANSATTANNVGGKTADDLIHNNDTETAQTADFNISGNGKANSLQGNTSVISPLFDRDSSGTLSIGTVNASSIDIGTNNANHTIRIGTGTGTQSVTLGSASGASELYLQGGTGGVGIYTNGGFTLNSSGTEALKVLRNGRIELHTTFGQILDVMNSSGSSTFRIWDDKRIETAHDSSLTVYGTAYFDKGINIQGTTIYTTPGGYNMTTAVGIPNYPVSNFSSIFAFGLPSTSAATARGMLVADARTGNHQATIGILSPSENNVFGLSYNGSEDGYLSNTGNDVILQGNGLNLLRARNISGNAAVGIGNNANAGHALDVTGDINASGQYRIDGSTVLTESALTFRGSSPSSISSVSGQSLNISGDQGINLSAGGQARVNVGNSNVRIGDGNSNNTATLLTLDGASSAPTGILGSMYYDTTLGKVQCYEADGWGACGAAPDTFITLSPEYSNAVMNGADIGTITSDLCSDTLNINDGSSGQPTICGTDETQNFYGWTSEEGSDQTRSIYVTYQLPENFKEFVAGSTSLMGRTDSANASVTYRVYRDSASAGLISCGGSATAVSSDSQSSWQTQAMSGGSDPSTCGFEAGESILIRIDMTAKSNANAYVSDLNFTYSSE